MNAPLTAWISGIGLIAPGLPDWPSARAVLRGEQAWVSAPSVLPAPALLPPAERRRASRVIKLSLGIGLNGNKGFEGLAYDAKDQRLLVAKERDPVRIFEVLGFPHVDESKPLALQVNTDPKRDARLFVRDLSSLDFDTATGHLLALSDESRLVIELNTEGKPISTLSLLRGQHGLQRSVPQGEGVATDDDGNLYLISEPNLFYMFRKQAD